MKARRIEELGSALPRVIDATLISRWMPGRHYRVSTISTKSTASNPSDIFFVGSLPPYATQVFGCDRIGIPATTVPLFSLEANTDDEALTNHRKAVKIFTECSLSEVAGHAAEEMRKHPEWKFFTD